MKKILLVPVLVMFVLSACSEVETRINDKADIEKGTKVAEEFLNYIKAKDYTKAMGLTKISADNPDFQTHVKQFTEINDQLGDITAFKQDTAYSSIAQAGQAIEGSVSVRYTVDYTRGKTKETYLLTLSDGEVKIMSYNINNE